MAGNRLLQDQIEYYRARAGEYDEWWFRTGRYDRGLEFNASWRVDVGEVERALAEWLDTRRPRNVLELACGTGLFTRLLAPKVERLTAIDASPEVLAINRARVPAHNVDYVQADLFAWRPRQHYDVVFFSFWLSHVPDERFAAFWESVRAALAPGGAAYLIDSAFDPTSTAKDHAVPEREAGIVTRRLNDGREFQIVKLFYEPATLDAKLARVGFASRMRQTARYFIYGEALPIAS
jgi:demethylmenaquinone methyltransferase/2-methoxy-6-polyprenyl-1,4-benzoquinol methylase